MKKVVAFLCCSLLFAATASATHITHGNMYHQYIRTVGDKAEYKITLVLYRDCNASQVPFDDIVTIGIYGGGFGQLKETREISKTESASGFISPLVEIGRLFCLKKATYETIISVDTNFQTAVVFQRCCRPTLNNIIDDEGSIFYTVFFPNKKTSSALPCNEDPVVIGRAIETEFTLAHYSRGANKSIYQLVTPFKGGSITDPIPEPENNLDNFQEVIYRSGYNKENPFGKDGYTVLDSSTGRVQIFSSKQGKYALAFMVHEWLDGTYRVYYREIIVNIVSQNPDSINLIRTYARASTFGGRTVVVSWSHNMKDEVEKFIIQRAEAPSYVWTDIGTTDTATLHFFDTSAHYNIKYKYRVVAKTKASIQVYGQSSDYVIITNYPLGTNYSQSFPLNLYPNPAANAFTINTHEEIKAIALLDVFGKQVYHEKVPGGTTAEIILPADISPGIYMVQVYTAAGIETARIVKQ